jgi:hypothetical protein
MRVISSQSASMGAVITTTYHESGGRNMLSIQGKRLFSSSLYFNTRRIVVC